MFVRVKRSVQEGREYQYLQIVQSVRQGAQVRQKVIANLGRAEELLAGDGLDNLIRSLVKFSQRLRVIEAGKKAGVDSCRSKAWGPALVFGRLWEEQGLREVIAKLAEGRRFGFEVEQIGRATV